MVRHVKHGEMNVLEVKFNVIENNPRKKGEHVLAILEREGGIMFWCTCVTMIRTNVKWLLKNYIVVIIGDEFILKLLWILMME